MNELRRKRQLRANLIEQAQALYDQIEAEGRELTDEEQEQVDAWMDEADSLQEEIEGLEGRQQRRERVATAAAGLNQSAGRQTRTAPAFNRIPRGDNEERAFAHFLRTGDDGGIREMRASNDTDMNITTSADGGYAVPVGHYQGIIARRDELSLPAALGVMRIPGVGTTVNVPVDAEDDGEFVSTAEVGEYDRDAPALGQVAMTLVKYTKKVELSVELLEDEDSRLMAFLNDFVGRGMAKTHNGLLLTEVAANGSNLNTFTSASAIAAGELEEIEGGDNLGAYLEDANVSWVMRNSTLSAIRSITDDARFYGNSASGGPGVRFNRTLLEYPVFRSNKALAIGAGNKSIFFGNWSYVGFREAPGFTVIRDPYTLASKGQVRLVYMFRAVYKVLQAEAVGYGVHPTA